MALGLFTLLVALVTPLILSWIIASWITTTRNKTPPPPPQAKGAWPIIGHLLTKLTQTSLGSMADEYGPIFGLRLGSIQAVVVSNSEVAKELFTTHDVTVSSRPKLVVSEYFGYNYALFGLAPYGPYWRDVRKLSMVHLLSNSKLEDLKEVRVFEVEESIREVYKLWSTTQQDKSGQVLVEMKQVMYDMTYNMSVRMIAGKRCYGSSAKSKEAKECHAALREFFDILGTPLVADCLPFLRRFDLGGQEKSMKRASRELDSIVQRWIDEHKMARKDQTDWAEQDFMDVLLTQLNGIELGGFDADTVNKSTCINLIVGGSDTTTVSIIWALSLLLNNRQALKRVQDEIDAQVGRHRKLDESDIPNLPYLQAIVKETLRLYPPAPLAAPREFTDDCTVAGFHVTKGTRLMINLQKIQRDPMVWPDPLKFQPERFLTTHKHIDVQGGNFELIPFSAGRRMCPGVSMALCLMHLALGSFLQAFDFSTPNNAPVDMEEGFGLTTMRANPLNVLMAPRLSSHLYV